LDETLRVTLAHVAELLDLHTGWIWLLNDNSDTAYLAAAQHLPPALTKKRKRMEGSCYCLDTFRSGDLDGAANVNIITCSRLKWLEQGTDGLRYHASIPLYAHSKELGVLNVASQDWREVSCEDLRLLYTIGDMLSIAIERVKLFNQSVQMGAIEERNRLAREIHDTLAQGLTAITLQLETADAHLEKINDAKKLQHAIQKALRLSRENLEEARRSVQDLRAAPLENRTLAEAIKSLIDPFQSNSNARVIFQITGENRPLPVRIETGIYRIIQEALTNIHKHASAREVNLQLDITPDRVNLTIKDDGMGFDPDQISPGHFGLIGLRERTKLLGGQLTLQSNPGRGTLLEVSFPL
jgi:two-component system NarL family sensor kinase